MNKLERRLKGNCKFKKRLTIYNNGPRRILLNIGKFHILKTTGKPCSCAMCSPGKVEEKAKYRLNNFNKNKLWD